MPIKRLRLCQLGDQEAFSSYQAEFDRLFHGGPIFEARNYPVFFPPNSCEHICFTPTSKDPRFIDIRDSWDQARAERIAWIHAALTDPDEIRPNHQFPRNEAYLLELLPDHLTCIYSEYYYVTVKPEPKRVVFLSAYPINVNYWRDARRVGPVRYRRHKR